MADDVQWAFRVIEHTWIPMADGVRLSARLWIPEDCSPLPPAVLEYIPYRKRDSYRIHDSAWGAALASNGIAFARVDVRGTGDSEGILVDEYTEQELADGVEIIDWLAQQSWNNGRVGMRGISWGAINTLQIAARQPPALMATIAIAGTDHRYLDDAHYIGGLYGRANLEWGVLCKSVLASPPDPEIVGEDWLGLWQQRLESSRALIGNWSSHQNFDSYWQRGSAALDYPAIACPVYVVAGLLDTYVNPVGRMLAELPGPSKGLVGCWGHTYPDTAAPNGVAWLSEELRWWRHWLQDEDTGMLDEPQLWVFMPEVPPFKALPQNVTGHWHAEAVWPPQASEGNRYYLDGDRLCNEVPGGCEGIRYELPVAVGASRPEWVNQPPDEQSKDDELSITFDSPMLAGAQQLLGYAHLNIRLSAETPVAGIWVRLNEVFPDGSSWPVSHFAGSLNRLLDMVDPPELQADREYSFEIPLNFAAHVFQPGSRIRLALSAPPWPMTLTLPEPMCFILSLQAASLWLPSPSAISAAADFPIADRPGTGAQPRHAKWRCDSDSNLRCDHAPSEYSYRDRETGTRLSARTSGTSAFRVSGETVWHEVSERSWQRQGWDCLLAAGCRLSAQAHTLTIEEWLEASREGEVIFSRKHRNTIPRRLI